MSANFDWQTEEEIEWDALPSDKRPSRPKRPFRHWWLLLVTAVLLVAAGGAIFWNINRRATQGEQRVRDDLIATQQFITQAGLEGEADLFWSALSGRDMGWVETMVTLVEQERYRDFPALGLVQTGEPAPIQASFEPDFSAVNVLQPISYTVTLPTGEPQTISLTHLEVYRRGRAGWLLARHSPTMWGETQTQTVGRITSTFPEWDEELAERLTADLAAELLAMCQLLAHPCAADFVISLTFSTDVESLLVVAEPERLLRQGLDVTLPTPTLIGKPNDEAAYQALLRGYAGALLTAVLANQTGYSCCTQYPFFQALVDYQLAELELKAWPISEAVYAAAVESGFSFANLESFWEQTPLMVREDEQDLTAVYLALDYLVQTYAPEEKLTVLAERQRQLAFISYGTWLLNWITAVEDDTTSPISAIYRLDANWREAARVAAGPDLPAGSLVLACQPTSKAQETAAFRFSLLNQQWEQLTEPTSDFFFISSLPNRQGIFFQQLAADAADSDAGSLTFWRGGEPQPGWPIGELDVTFGEGSPDGRFAVGFSFRDGEAPMPYLIDLAMCAEGDCQFSPLSHIPRWSPSGQFTIMHDAEAFFGVNISFSDRAYLLQPNAVQTAFAFQIGDERSSPLPGRSPLMGYLPFWLDEARLGWLEPFSGIGGEALMAYDVETGETAVLLTSASLGELFGEEALEPHQFSIRFALVNPAERNELVLGVVRNGWPDLYLFSFNQQTEAVTLFHAATPADSSLTSMAPNGRFVLTTTAAEGFNAANQLKLMTTETGEGATFLYDMPESFILDYLFDWQPEGDWLAVSPTANMLLLYHPESKTQHLIPHEQGMCSQIIWQRP